MVKRTVSLRVAEGDLPRFRNLLLRRAWSVDAAARSPARPAVQASILCRRCRYPASFAPARALAATTCVAAAEGTGFAFVSSGGVRPPRNLTYSLLPGCADEPEQLPVPSPLPAPRPAPNSLPAPSGSATCPAFFFAATGGLIQRHRRADEGRRSGGVDYGGCWSM